MLEMWLAFFLVNCIISGAYLAHWWNTTKDRDLIAFICGGLIIASALGPLTTCAWIGIFIYNKFLKKEHGEIQRRQGR